MKLVWSRTTALAVLVAAAAAATYCEAAPSASATLVRRGQTSTTQARRAKEDGNKDEEDGAGADGVDGVAETPETCELPDIADIIEAAFPTYEVDDTGAKVEGSEGRWTPLYYTKRWNGLDHPLAYPSPIDTHYPFEYAAPFLGQPGAGSPHHCPTDSPSDQKVQECPKVSTASDDDETFGPGHIGPWIPLRSLRDAYLECGNATDISTWFDDEEYGCRVKPDVLLSLVRKYYPRDESTGDVEYPPPADPDTPEYYPLEFPSPEGPPHWCTPEFTATGQWADWCPYVYEGDDAGKYRHPHIALAALEQHLANKVMPDKCGTEWDVTQYPLAPDSSWDWVDMESDDPMAQPVLPYAWPENNATSTVKDVVSIAMATELYVDPSTDAPTAASSNATDAAPTAAPTDADDPGTDPTDSPASVGTAPPASAGTEPPASAPTEAPEAATPSPSQADPDPAPSSAANLGGGGVSVLIGAGTAAAAVALSSLL